MLALLQRSAGNDGNMLLNIGPKPDGTIEDRQVKVLGAKVMGSTDVVAVEQSDTHLQFSVPVKYRDTPNLVVELTLDRSAMEIDPIATVGSDAKPESLR